jgi:hypothetical protein
MIDGTNAALAPSGWQLGVGEPPDQPSGPALRTAASLTADRQGKTCLASL